MNKPQIKTKMAQKIQATITNVRTNAPIKREKVLASAASAYLPKSNPLP